ncbi:MAG: hypothetical protein E7366_03240 [Clostridiales bacterium]|nr:hypothetical protein [Clostridiales bacterium]
MKTSSKLRKKQLLALFLSVMMTSSLAALASCTDDEKTDSSSTSSSSAAPEEEVDTGIIKNAHFKTFNTNGGLNVIGTSVTGWTRSAGSANSSKSASGIVDTSKWDDMTTNAVEDPSKLSDKDAEDKWATLTTKDKLEFYEAWKDANPKKTISKELKDFYQSFNVDAEDLPTCKNPGVAPDSKDSNVLMIHNNYYTSSYKGLGTAQKYTASSTVTVKAGTSAEFSVWVRTSDLECATTEGKDPQPAVDKGAYISVAHTVGGKSMDAFEIKNIQTDEWTQYSFYLQGASNVDTTFTVSLGLGQGTTSDRLEYVNGYAFFDDIECNTISNATYAEKVEGIAEEYVMGFESAAEDKVFTYSADMQKVYALDFFGGFEAYGDFLTAGFDIAATTEKSTSGKKTYTAAAGVEGTEVFKALQPGFNVGNDLTNSKVYSNTELKAATDEYVQKVYNNYFADGKYLNGENENILLLISSEGAAYTATNKTTFTLDAYNPDDENAKNFYAISFFVKTSDMQGVTGAGVTLNELDEKGEIINKTSISSIDTTSLSKVDINEETKDIYDGWQQCVFFVSNETDAAKTFSLSFTYGPTGVVSTTKTSYYAGFAAFAGFEQSVMTEKEFASATSGTYTKTVSLTGVEEEKTGDSGFDATSGTSDPNRTIEKGFATLKNYKGVYSDSAYVSNGTDTAVNQLATAGLFNKEYVTIENENGEKVENADYKAVLEKLGATTWEEAFGNATQPVVIYNEAAGKSYGFIGAATTIAANSYKTISLRVKVSEGSTAFVYLMDMEDDTHQKKLAISNKLTYWYDDEGNVCAKDPSDEHFNAKYDVAFKLQANGLYTVNPVWNAETKSGLDEKAYYANLSAYEVKGTDLVIAEGGASYDYNGEYKNDGMDGIAFYGYNAEAKTAYAYPVGTENNVVVTDFSKVAALAPRTTTENSKDLVFEIGATNGEWATVTFYLHTGDTEKNYRLEIWSGARDGETTAGYVMFDSNKPADVDATSFANLIDLRKDDVTEENKFEGAFSFYDSAKYLRYDETLDVNGVGNSYESYLPSAYTSGIAYLKYVGVEGYEMYADYSLSEVTVTPDVEEEDTTTEEEDEHNHEGETNFGLLFSSIAVAVVLVLAVASIIVRKIVEASRKKKGAQARKAERKAKKSDK